MLSRLFKGAREAARIKDYEAHMERKADIARELDEFQRILDERHKHDCLVVDRAVRIQEVRDRRLNN